MTNPLLLQPDLTHEYLARVALDGSFNHLEHLQQAVDSVASAAASTEIDKTFDSKTLEFLTALFDNPWWGGKDLGFNYAQYHWGQQQQKPLADLKQPQWAQLQSHFVNGSGQSLTVNRQLYQSSRMVQDVLAALKQFIRNQHRQKRAVNLVSSQTKDFLISNEALKLEEARRSNETLGYIFNDGTLLVEQKDPRLNRVYDRFVVNAFTTLMGNQFMTRWRISGLYSYAPFAGSSGKTGLVLNDNCVLQVPFFLGHRLVEQGVARDFEYSAEWMEWHAV